MGSISGSERSLARGHGNPLQYSCLENPMIRETRWAIVYRVTQTQIGLKGLSTHYEKKYGVSLCCVCVCAQQLQLCPTLCDPVDCSPPASSVHGIFPARILEWVAMSSSRGSSQPRDQTCISQVSCFSRQVLYHQHHLGSFTKYSPLLCIISI